MAQAPTSREVRLALYRFAGPLSKSLVCRRRVGGRQLRHHQDAVCARHAVIVALVRRVIKKWEGAEHRASNTCTAVTAVVQRLIAAFMSGIRQCSYCDSVNVPGTGERPQAATVFPFGKKPTRIVIPLAAAWLNIES